MTDRPWGLTLGAIALRRHTGQLTIESDGKRYCIAFEDGAIVAATSPQAADAIARVALTSHFITSTQVGDIQRRLQMAPERDEVDVLADAIRFTADQATKLRHRLVAQRAARTFSLERGEFVLDNRVAMPVVSGVSVDIRQVVYLGVRTNVSEQRLADDLRQLGSYFVLKPEAEAELPHYGFEPAAEAVIDALKLGTSLPELEATQRDLDPRFAKAIMYALVSCTACIAPQRGAPAVVTARPHRRSSGALGTHAGEPSTGRRAAGTRETLPHPAGAPAAPVTPVANDPPEPGTTQAPEPGTPRPGSNSQPPMAMGTATFRELSSDTTQERPPARTTRPPGPGRTTTAPLGARTRTGSATSYSTPTPEDSGTNTPAAMRTRTRSDSQIPAPAARSTLPPQRSGSPTSPPARPAPTPTAPPGSPSSSAASTPGTSGPAAPRTQTDDMAIPTEPAPPVLPAPRPGASRPPPVAQRPSVSRAPTPSDAEVRGFADQRTPGFGDQRTPSGFSDHRTPSGFSDHRTPGFGDHRTPGFGDHRTPFDQRTPGFSDQRTPTPGVAAARVATDNAIAAEEAFKRGELAMKRDQPGEAVLEFKAACDLNPTDVDYAGMLAWAKFCAAGDKPAIGADTRKALERAAYRSNKPERARFYLGRVERMLGRDREAMRHFQEVLDLKPNHADAASEIRAIEARLAAANKTGLFGRKR